MEILALDGGYLGIDDLMRVVGQDLGGHTDGNTLGALDEDYGNLCREDHWLLASAVVGFDVLGDLGVVENLLCKRKQAALDVSGSCRSVACHEVTVVTLLVYEEVAVGQIDEGRVDGGISVRMVVHGRSDDVGDLVEAPVVHLDHGVKDSSLYGLEAVLDIGNGPVLYDI